MIKHLFKLLWNRKRTNLLIVAEVFFSFLILFAVVTLGVYNLRNYLQPLGFRYDNVWIVNLSSVFRMDVAKEKGAVDDVRRMMDALREMPQVEAVAGLGFPMFEIGSSSGNKKYKDRSAYSYYNEVTDDFRDVMKIELVEGRWFEPADDALAYEPIVINRRLRDELFRGEDGLGKTIFDQHQKRDLRVVGVISDFREDGELSPPDNYFLQRIGSKAGKPLEVMSLVVRLRSGTPPGFEEQIVKRLRSLSRDRTFYIESLAAKRRGYQKLQIAPLAAGGLVAGFMMVMVALGMIGVVWQSVTRRAREIGLRRAMGASARDIAVQVLAELILIATFGMALGTALVIQAPLLELVSWLTTPLFLASLAISLTCIYLLTIAAGLYPSWLASRVHPAGVLHYE